MLNIGNDVIKGHHSTLYSTLLGIANRSETKKAQEKVWREEEMTRLHMEAHKEDMMRSMHLQ